MTFEIAKFAAASVLQKMITRALPHIVSHQDAPPNLTHNALIFAKTTDAYYYPRHKTPFMLATQWQGKGRYNLNGLPIEISNRDFYFLNANDELEIKFEDRSKLETLLIMFEEQFVRDAWASLSASDNCLLQQPDQSGAYDHIIPPLPFELSKEIKNILIGLVATDRTGDELDEVLFGLIAQLSRENDKVNSVVNRIPVAKRSTKLEIYKRLHNAKEYINDQIGMQIGLEEVARAAGMNKFHLLSHFRKRYGATPYQFLLEARLQKANELLSSQKYTVSEVCNMVGFESIGSFSNTFMKRFNIRPSALLK